MPNQSVSGNIKALAYSLSEDNFSRASGAHLLKLFSLCKIEDQEFFFMFQKIPVSCQFRGLSTYDEVAISGWGVLV